jgi:hypothetical protein
MDSIFRNVTLPSGFVFPTGFGANARSMRAMFSGSKLNGNIYWKTSIINNRVNPIDVDYMFGGTRWNGHKMFVPDVTTRNIFTKTGSSGTGASAKNIVVENLPIKHKDTPKFSDIGKLAKSFQDAIKWLYKYGITTGTDSSHFSPSKGVTRGQMSTFLYREAGNPEWNETNCGFSDIGKLSTESKKAICWLKAVNITTGTDAKHFSPSKIVTRNQMALFLYRFADTPKSSSTSCGFSDNSKLSKESKIAICALKNGGVTTGTDKTHYSPSKTVTRGQMAAFLNREYNWIRK